MTKIHFLGKYIKGKTYIIFKQKSNIYIIKFKNQDHHIFTHFIIQDQKKSDEKWIFYSNSTKKELIQRVRDFIRRNDLF